MTLTALVPLASACVGFQAGTNLGLTWVHVGKAYLKFQVPRNKNGDNISLPVLCGFEALCGPTLH